MRSVKKPAAGQGICLSGYLIKAVGDEKEGYLSCRLCSAFRQLHAVRSLCAVVVCRSKFHGWRHGDAWAGHVARHRACMAALSCHRLFIEPNVGFDPSVPLPTEARQAAMTACNRRGVAAFQLHE